MDLRRSLAKQRVRVPKVCRGVAKTTLASPLQDVAFKGTLAKAAPPLVLVLREGKCKARVRSCALSAGRGSRPPKVRSLRFGKVNHTLEGTWDLRPRGNAIVTVTYQVTDCQAESAGPPSDDDEGEPIQEKLRHGIAVFRYQKGRLKRLLDKVFTSTKSNGRHITTKPWLWWKWHRLRDKKQEILVVIDARTVEEVNGSVTTSHKGKLHLYRLARKGNRIKRVTGGARRRLLKQPELRKYATPKALSKVLKKAYGQE